MIRNLVLGPVATVLPDRLQHVLKELSEYRKQLIEQRHSEEKLLSSTFWIQIYDNHKATREEVEEYFESENDPEVQSIPNRRRADINALYNNMRHIYKSPSHAVWFLFWSDVWESNKDLKKITQFDEDLNPQYVTRCFGW
jgi:type IV secretory pathway VirB4 component